MRRARLLRTRNSCIRPKAEAEAATKGVDDPIIKLLKFLFFTDVAAIVFYSFCANFPMAVILIPFAVFLWLMIVFCK